MLQKGCILLVCLLSLASCDDNHRNSDILNAQVLPDTIRQYITKHDTIVEIREPVASVREKYVDSLKQFLGAKEVNASNTGPVIDLFFTDCGIEKGLPYCGCFANYGLYLMGIDGPDCPAWTPCWFPDGKVVSVHPGENGDKLQEGDMFGIYFRSKGRIAHIGVIVEDLGYGYVLTIEGNTNSAGSREGHGVFMRLRHKDELYKVSDWLSNPEYLSFSKPMVLEGMFLG